MTASSTPSTPPITAARSASTTVTRRPVRIAGANWNWPIARWSMCGLFHTDTSSAPARATTRALLSQSPGRRSGTTRRGATAGTAAVSDLDVLAAVDRRAADVAALEPVLLQDLQVGAVGDHRVERLLELVAEHRVRLRHGDADRHRLVLVTGDDVEDLPVAGRLGEIDHHRRVAEEGGDAAGL